MRVLLSGGGTAGHVVPILSVVSALQGDCRPATLESLQQAEPPTQAQAAVDRQPSSGAANQPKRNEPAPLALNAARGAGLPADGRRQTTACDQREAVQYLYVGEAGGIEQSLAERAGIPFREVETGQIRGQSPQVIVRSLRHIARGAGQCAELLRRFQPDVALITGGYVTAPVAWAAWRQHIPLVIYLPDLTPGLAVRATSQLASRVAVSFPEVARYFGHKTVVTGYPVRPELTRATKPAARIALGLAADTAVLLVVGGSRGARSINQAVIAGLPALLERCQIVHISGQRDWPSVAEARGILPAELAARYHAFPYLHEEMVDALAAADLVVARAGASTLGEFPVRGLPSILVPYPYAGQHQEANAAYLAERGAAIALADANLSDQLVPLVSRLLGDPGILAAMSKAAAALARPDAAANIGTELKHFAGCHGS
jgi:UDP-N-acetylglucosamine--N-acetylmuramyl-(pentapeptide) pyrophosphoryl-undecaprenol N-acetylglucosamine transferase